MSLTTDVIDLLDELGDTANWVAASLEKLGIKGVREQGCACPVYNYLASKGLPVYEVGDEEITFDVMNVVDGNVFRERVAVETPEQITEFIYAFDQGEFPELDEDPGSDPAEVHE